MTTPEYYWAAARAAEEDAADGRGIAARLWAAGGELGSQLDHSRRTFTEDVWESSTADRRREELAALDRQLVHAEADLRQLVWDLRSFADRRDEDAAHLWEQYHRCLALAEGPGL